MQIFSKSCPHCKTGDITIEEFIDKALGKLYSARCFQCGWQKIIPNILSSSFNFYKFDEENEIYTSV